jgi:hypothetical protein
MRLFDNTELPSQCLNQRLDLVRDNSQSCLCHARRLNRLLS